MCGRIVSHTAINFLNNAHGDNDVADQAYDPSVECMVGSEGSMGMIVLEFRLGSWCHHEGMLR